ncbi:DUF881 domain-containing protein [Bifidobacterium jacchi]|uniref:DUF881 domain-containing protein n=1 Tax=Bifidobacterium jacchi TaxID=2490545 RepID=A0A5N5RM41_9BIFI|nr:DUF881 domain-containing protein [Bifidobacterium jacchi]
MARRTGRHGVKRSAAAGVATFLLVALSGYLLMTNVRVNRSAVVSSDTADLIEQRVRRVDELRDDVAKLSSQIDTVKDLAVGSAATSTPQGEDAGSGTVLPAVHGPGVSVTLDDSPLWEKMVDDSGSTANINDYVIHQEDIESVVNALWAGGAESMMIQDQRVLSNSAIVCQGNVLLLQGKKYSPPYTVSAIGPTDRMLQALDDSNAIKIYKEYVSAFGVGWNVETKADLKFPESAALLQPLRYSSVDTTQTEEAKAAGKTDAESSSDQSSAESSKSSESSDASAAADSTQSTGTAAGTANATGTANDSTESGDTAADTTTKKAQ